MLRSEVPFIADNEHKIAWAYLTVRTSKCPMSEWQEIGFRCPTHENGFVNKGVSYG
jgi:hypothetical protein